MKFSMCRLALGLSSCLGLFFFSATIHAAEKVRLAYPARSLSALHIRVAQERGFYRKYGLEVEAIQMRPTISAAALISGEVRYLASVGSAIRSAGMAAPVKIVSVANVAPFFSLVARHPYMKIEQLKGKEIGLTGNPGGTNDRVARFILKQAGVDPQKDVQLIYAGDPPLLYSAFRGGRFDAMFISLPFPVLAEQQGYRILVNAAEKIRVPLSGLAVTDETLKIARDQVKRMIKADVEARRLIRREKEAAVEVMVTWLGLERPVARRSYDLYLPAVSGDVTVEREGVRLILEMEVESGVPIKITDPDQIIDAKMVEEVKRELSR
jgi:NitT/TauT family transport system substrate-binding protein